MSESSARFIETVVERGMTEEAAKKIAVGTSNVDLDVYTSYVITYGYDIDFYAYSIYDEIEDFEMFIDGCKAIVCFDDMWVECFG